MNYLLMCIDCIIFKKKILGVQHKLLLILNSDGTERGTKFKENKQREFCKYEDTKGRLQDWNLADFELLIVETE